MFKKNLFSKAIVFIITTSFILTSGPGYYSRAYGRDNLRPEATRRKANTDGGTMVEALLRDFGFSSQFLKIFAENVIVGSEKGSEVGEVLSLRLLREENLDGTILGHSANRKAYIKEVSEQIYNALVAKGVKKEEAEQVAREQAFKRYDEILRSRISAMIKEGLIFTLCVGSDRDNLPIDEEIKDVLAQLEVSLKDVTSEMLESLTFYLAWEPAGKIGTGKAQPIEDIRKVHQAIYNWLETKFGATTTKKVWGKSFKLLYGASVDKNNVGEIMAVKSQRPGMEGVPLVHGVLFASAGKKVEGFLPVAEAVNKAAIRDNGVYVCMMNFKQFTKAERTPIKEYVAAIYQAILEGRISPDKTILVIADQDVHLNEWRVAVVGNEMRRVGSYSPLSGSEQVGDSLTTDGGTLSPDVVARVRGLDDLFRVIESKALSTGIVAVDWNDPRKGDLLEGDKKIRGSLPTLIKLLEQKDVQEMFILTHSGRAKGSYKSDLTLKPMVERVNEFLNDAATEKGFEYKKGKFIKLKIPRQDVVVEFLAYEQNDKNSDDYFKRVQEQIKQARETHKGKKIIFVVDNIRFFREEQSKESKEREKFEENLIRLTGKSVEKIFYVNDAFEKSHRGEDASMELVKLIPFEHRGASDALKENIEQLKEFGEQVSGTFSIIYGGAKFDKSTYVVDSIVKAMREIAGRQGKVWILGALANPVLSALGKETGLSLQPEGEDIKIFEAAWQKIQEIKESSAYLHLPVDFIVLKDKEPVAVDVGDKDIEKDGILGPKQSQVDIGPKTLKSVIDYIYSLEKGDGLVINGGAGIFEEAYGREGTFSIIEAASKVAEEKGVVVFFAGGDMNRAVELYEKVTGKKVSSKVLRSKGGGVVLEALNEDVKNLLPIAALIDTGVSMSLLELQEMAQRLNVSPETLKHALQADARIYNIAGGEAFNAFLKNLFTPTKLTAEKIYDSRGKSTVRAFLKTWLGLETSGDVPAGASKGEAEAKTVDTDQAIKNIIEIIAPILKKMGLNLAKHEDLLKAEKMIIERGGDNFKDLGANASVPISWALWKMAATLNNMGLWEYIMKNEPEAVGSYITLFYMNLFNGGLHALKPGEKLNVDRIALQEIMVVPITTNYRDALAMGDKINIALKEILEDKFGKDKVTIGDEAGLSVKGLGNSEEAIGFVVQAIEKAGYTPGVDVKIALDVAATTFYNKEKNLYEFEGKERTSDEMIDFYRQLADKYKGLILSIEDGLAENDWEGWTKLRMAMERLGIDTIGDDLFVTQLSRLKKGIENKAATGILIKVNQNGTVSGTLEVIKLAIANGLKIIISHRSGETLASDIAHLAYGAFGLKAGAPQPEEIFPDKNQWVRRKKYLEMIKIQEGVTEQIQHKALIVSQESFKVGGIYTALREAAQLSKLLKIGIYGEDAEKLKVLLGNEDVIIAETAEKLVEKLANLGIKEENILAVSFVEDNVLAEKQIRQIVTKELGSLALAKAVKELSGSEVIDALSDFYNELKKLEIVSQKTYEETQKAVLDELEKGTFKFPENMLTEHVSEKIQKDLLTVETFITYI